MNEYEQFKPKELVLHEYNPRIDLNIEPLVNSMVTQGYDTDYPMKIAEMPEDTLTPSGKLLKKGSLVVVNGRRRREAAMKAGLPEVTGIRHIMTYEQARREIAKEVFTQEGYTPLEKSRMIIIEKEKENLSNRALAERYGLDSKTVDHYVNLNKLSSEVKEFVEKDKDFGLVKASYVSQMPAELQGKFVKRARKKWNLYNRDVIKKIEDAMDKPYLKTIEDKEEKMNDIMDQIEGVDNKPHSIFDKHNDNKWVDPKNSKEDKVFHGKLQQPLKKTDKSDVNYKILNNKHADKLINIEKDLGLALDELNGILTQKETFVNSIDLVELYKTSKAALLKREAKKNEFKIKKVVEYLKK